MTAAPTTTTPAPTSTAEDTASAGRGGIAIFAAKAYFIVTGFVQQPLLPLAIGLSGYGALSRVLAIANVFNNVVVASCTQGMSRAVAQSKGAERKTLARLMPVHAAIAVIGALVLAALAGTFARFESAPHIEAPLYAMAILLGLYGVYAPLVGYFNGTRKFGRQAALDMTAATLRTALLIGGGFLFVRRGASGALGAAAGAVIAAFLVFSVAVVWVRDSSLAPRDAREDTGAAPVSSIKTSTYLLQLLPIALSQLFTNALMQSDLTFVGRFLSISAHDACMLHTSANDLAACTAAAAKNADEWVAVYRACQLFAFLPFQLLFSVTQVLFPMLAKSAAAGDRADVMRLTSRGARLGAILCGLPVSIIIALPGSFLGFVYGSTVEARGAHALHVLALGQMAFAMTSLGTTILVSLGKEVQAMVLTLVALGLVAGACFLTVPARAFGEDQLVATATATACALALAMVVSFMLVVRAAGAFIPLPTVVRVGAAVLAAWALGGVTPHFGKIILPLVAIVVAVVYLAILVVTRELGRADLAWVRSLAKRGKK